MADDRDPVLPTAARLSGRLLMFDWCVDKLRRRGFDVRVLTYPSTKGVVFKLSVPPRERKP